MADRSAWPQPLLCHQCGSRSPLVATESYSQSVTGVRTHLYVCTECLKGTWIRYLPSLPVKYLALGVAPTSSDLVRKALIGLGWKAPRGKSRPNWTPPD